MRSSGRTRCWAAFLAQRSQLAAGVRICAAAACLANTLALAGTEPKTAAQDYPVHAGNNSVAVGAEFFFRTVPAEKESYFSGDYVVVEVALYPTLRRMIAVRQDHFRLKINGKELMYAQNPGIVAAATEHPEWERQRGMVASAGVGDAGVIFGQPRRRPRFPGDPSARSPLPPPNGDDSRTQVQADPLKTVGEAIRALALDDGDIDYPASGFLYFPWAKKTKEIKTVELIYDGPAGKFTLKLL